MTPEDKIARQRLDVLELAKTLGNVSEACRRRGMTRPHSSLKGLPPLRARIAGAALNQLSGWTEEWGKVNRRPGRSNLE